MIFHSLIFFAKDNLIFRMPFSHRKKIVSPVRVKSISSGDRQFSFPARRYGSVFRIFLFMVNLLSWKQKELSLEK